MGKGQNDAQLEEEQAEESEAGLPGYLDAPSDEEEKLQAIRIAALRALFRQTGSASAKAVLADRRMKQYCGNMSEKQLHSVLEVFPENFMISDSDETIALLSIDVDDISMLGEAVEKGLLKNIGQKKNQKQAGKPKAKAMSQVSEPTITPRRPPPAVPDGGGEYDEDYLHEVISHALEYSVHAVAGMETTWTPDQMCNRITKYIFKAATSSELSGLSWKEAAKKLVQGTMQGYSGACGEKPWFYELDIVPTLCAAANIVIEKSTGRRQLYELIALEFEEFLDRALLEKGFWDAVEVTFGEEEAKTKNKIFKALSGTYWAAFDEVFTNRQHNELRNVEAFARQWIKESMNRAWVSLENAESTLTHESVSALFLATVAPFGQDHPFSCIPFALCMSIGIPPPDWQFVHVAVDELVHGWREGGGKKRRKTGADTYDEPAPPPVQSKAPKGKGKGKDKNSNGKRVFKPGSNEGGKPRGSVAAAEDCQAGTGHPECTSAEDCIGSPNSRLVQHRLSNKEAGDIYCEPCWCTFVRRNPRLQGDFLD